MSRTLGAFVVIVLALAHVGNGQISDEPDSVAPKLKMPKAFSTSATTSSNSDGPISATLTKFPQEPSQPEVIGPPVAPEPVPSTPDAPSAYSELAPIVGEGYPDRSVIPSRSSYAEAWIGGLSMYVLKPHWTNGNPAIVTSSPNGSSNAALTVNNFSYDYSASPAVWFGYLNQFGNGIRANFFQFHQGSTASALVKNNQIQFDNFFGSSWFGLYTFYPNSTMTVTSGTQLIVFDLEALKRVNNANWSWMASGGIRYAYLDQKYEAGIGPSWATANGSSFLSARHYFNVVGPTISAQARRPVGDTPFGFFGSGRAALLYGNFSQTISQSPVSLTPGSLSSSAWSVLPQTELEFGADFRRPFGGMTMVIENALTGQAWFGAGTSSNVSGGGGYANSSTLGFYGWRSSIGFTY
jgi:hypothetical protein